jgi:hypothetical protein
MGHSDAPMPKSDFHKFINAARHAAIEKSELKGYIYKEDGVEIVIRERTLHTVVFNLTFAFYLRLL